MESVFVLVFVILLLIFFYFIPSFNAYGRRHKWSYLVLVACLGLTPTSRRYWQKLRTTSSTQQKPVDHHRLTGFLLQ